NCRCVRQFCTGIVRAHAMSIMRDRGSRKSSRRQFLSQVGRAGILVYPALGARSLWAQSPGAPTNLRLASNNPGARSVLSAKDFTYLGAFRMPEVAGGGDAQWGKGLTHRYVNGQLRFFSSAWNPQTVYEVAAPSQLGSDALSAATASIVNIWG